MMVQLSRVLSLTLLTACLSFGQQSPPESSETFRAGTELVLVPFNVIQGKYFAPDLKREDVLLLQDGKPRDFTVFEGPATGHRPPLELALLFDTTTLPPPGAEIPVVNTHWDREATYGFTSHWGDAESRALLEKGGADVRVSVYRFDHRQLQCLCRSTRDPEDLTGAIHRLPGPLPAGEGVPLTLPPNRKTIDDLVRESGGRVLKTKSWPVSWTAEATMETLRDVNTRANMATRALVVFSEALGPTTTTPHDVADQAVALGIPVFPVVLDLDEYIRHPFVVAWSAHGPGSEARAPDSVPISHPDWVAPYDPNASSGPASNPQLADMSVVPMVKFGSLGELTGGQSIYPSRIDAGVVEGILELVRNEGLTQYLVGFAPPPSGRQRKHSLEIKLRSKSLGNLLGGKRTAVY